MSKTSPASLGPSGHTGIPEKQPRIHLGFIDASRALAALYVLFGHMFLQLVPYHAAMAATKQGLEKLLTFISVAFFRHGHIAVAVFIVISGFCLMIPLARHDKVELDGKGGFIKRRAWSILLPHFAALGIALLLFTVPGVSHVLKGEGYKSIPLF